MIAEEQASDRDELRATAEDLIADAVALQEIERVKASLDPSDPIADALADDAQALVRGMVPKVAAQREIVDGDAGTEAPATS